MRISDYERAALAKGVEIDEIRCKDGDVIICRGHRGGRKLVYDDEGSAFCRGRRLEELDLEFGAAGKPQPAGSDGDGDDGGNDGGR